MAERIEHTPYEWQDWRAWVVVLKRVSLKPIWGLCIFVAGYIALTATTVLIVLLTLNTAPQKQIPLAALIPVGLISVLFLWAFVKVYRREEGVLLPVCFVRMNKGRSFSVQTYRIPQPTGMGGTLPGAPTRWLVLERPGRIPLRLSQVYHDLDLLKVNLALAASDAQSLSRQ